MQRIKIGFFLKERERDGILSDNWSAKQDKSYAKLSSLCYSLLEEIDNLEEVDVPEYETK